ADVIRAARLMELAAPGEILCDDPTREAARQRKGMDHRFVPLPRYRLKGFEAPVRVYRVDPARTPAGREREWEQLLGVLDDTIDGNGRVVWVEGEPGAGAADLVAGLAEQAAGRTRRLGRPRQSPDEPPPPWPAVWADLLSVRSVTDPVLRREQVEAFFAALPESAPHPSLWNHLLGVTIPEPPAVAAMSPAERDAARRELLLGLIDEMAARKPVLVILEDAHRLDAAGWETA